LYINIKKNINLNIYIKDIVMAKAKGGGTSTKVNFGKRKLGVAKKAFNKHSPRPKAYRGQGR
jgi:hypothetical protein